MINKIINKTKVPILIWADDIESGALDQAIGIADHLPVHSHLALMPDVHAGMGIPIGAVLPLIDSISPNAVGADIGCGMISLKLGLEGIEMEQQKKMFGLIRERIPLGFNHRSDPLQWEGFQKAPLSKIIKQELQAAHYQLGTLGGGNHFIEFQKGDGHIWIMIHSGSRNLGKKVGDYYNALAKEHGFAPIADIPYFDIHTPYGQEYFEVMNFSLAFAQMNRDIMANTVLQAIEEVIGSFDVMERINIHHNYAISETHFGKTVMVHRKGATLATTDTIGIIPGSQGSKSYIVKGLGNEDSFQSCSHGAGRILSRSKAKKTLDIAVCEKRMADMGLICDFKRGNLDEAAEAYKNIETVMANQSDLVEIVVELVPYQIPAIKDVGKERYSKNKTP